MANIQRFVDCNQKTLKKTFSYYIMHITVAMLVGYFVTGSLTMAIALSLLEPHCSGGGFLLPRKSVGKKISPVKSVNGSLISERRCSKTACGQFGFGPFIISDFGTITVQMHAKYRAAVCL